MRWVNLPQILLLARKVVAVERFMGLTAQEAQILVPRQYLWKVSASGIARTSTSISRTARTGHSPFQIYRLWGVQAHRAGSRRYPSVL